jgi:hypothetical protein
VAGHQSSVATGTQISPADYGVAQLRRLATMSKVSLEGFGRGWIHGSGRQGSWWRDFLTQTAVAVGWTRGLPPFIGDCDCKMGQQGSLHIGA